MVVEAEIIVRHEGCYTELLVDGAHAAQLTADVGSSILVVNATSADQLREILRAFERVNPWPKVVMGETPTSRVLKIKNRPGGVITTILGAGCNIVWPAVYREGSEYYTVLAPDRARLESLYRALAPLGTAQIRRVNELAADALTVVLPFGDIAADLTSRQLEALMSAIHRGYYRSPRAVSSAELARAFGISRSTFEEHLRKAEAKLLGRFADLVEKHPALAKAAVRGAGRPKAARVTKANPRS